MHIYTFTVTLHFIFLFFSSPRSNLLSLSLSSLFLYHFLCLLSSLFRRYKLPPTSEEDVVSSVCGELRIITDQAYRWIGLLRFLVFEHLVVEGFWLGWFVQWVDLCNGVDMAVEEDIEIDLGLERKKRMVVEVERRVFGLHPNEPIF